MKSVKKQRGGARPGAGRKPLAAGRQKQRTITLDDAHREYALSIGKSTSDGIRAALDHHKDKANPTIMLEDGRRYVAKQLEHNTIRLFGPEAREAVHTLIESQAIVLLSVKGNGCRVRIRQIVSGKSVNRVIEYTDILIEWGY